ncbi:MAG: molybdate ABC transporter substrate-binding protein [Anaerolineaceae bacterium]
MAIVRFLSHASVVSVLTLLVAALSLSCGGGDAVPATPAATFTTLTAGDAPKAIMGEIRVFAASSLTDAFSAAGKRFNETNPGAQLVFNFGSSSALATQINEGAQADLFAAASPAQMLSIGRNAREPRTFATNRLAIALSPASRLQSYRDLASPNLKLVLAAKDVPAGQYARESLQKASAPTAYGADFQQKVLANLKSEEVNVRAALAKVQLGEADAAIVYTTDIAPNTGIRRIEIPLDLNIVAEYPLSVLSGAKNSAGATAFATFMLSSDGEAVLKRFGFGPAR